jgi:hypothetical protein
MAALFLSVFIVVVVVVARAKEQNESQFLATDDIKVSICTVSSRLRDAQLKA